MSPLLGHLSSIGYNLHIPTVLQKYRANPKILEGLHDPSYTHLGINPGLQNVTHSVCVHNVNA